MFASKLKLWLLLMTLPLYTGLPPTDESNKCYGNKFERYCSCVGDDSIQQCSSNSGNNSIKFRIHDRYTTIAVLDSLEQSGEGELPEDILEKASKKQWIILHTKHLYRLQPSFVDCSATQQMQISAPNLDFISDDYFKNCAKLELLLVNETQVKSSPTFAKTWCNLNSIIFKEGRLTELPGDFLKSCNKLTVLDLSANRIRSLPSTLFNGVEKVISVSFQQNLLQSLPNGLFAKCFELKDLSLQNNEIKEIPIDIFPSSGSKLRILHAQNNKLQNIPSTLGTTLQLLEELNLSHNELKEVPEDVLGKCKKLRNLNLKNNELKRIPEDFVRTCSNLFVINLSDNVIEELPSMFLGPCTELRNLQLENNLLTELPSKVFENCRRLSWVSVRNNRLKSISPNLLDNCPELDSVILSGNYLKAVSVNFLNDAILFRPNKLDLSNNQLQDTSTTVSLLHMPFGTASLTTGTIDISFNNLTKLHAGLFHQLNFMKILDASHNAIVEFGAGWAEGIQNLEELYLNSNALSTLTTDNIILLNGLRVFNLSNNRLESISDYAFVHLKKLVTLDLSGNRLQYPSVSNLILPASIQKLLLNENFLNRIPQPWIDTLPNSSVVLLDLRRNRVSAVELLSILEPLYEKQGGASSSTRDPVRPQKPSFIPYERGGDASQCVGCDLLRRFLDAMQAAARRVDVKYDVNVDCVNAIDIVMLEPYTPSANFNESDVINPQKYNTSNTDELTCKKISNCPEFCLCSRDNVDETVAVYCRSKNLTEVPLLPPENVSILYLQKNKLSSLDNLKREGCENLIELYLRNAILDNDVLKESSFQKLISLQKLDLSVNRIQSVPRGLLGALHELKFLNLSKNELSNISSGAFSYTPELTVLDLSWNNLQTLKDDILKNLTKLGILFLHRNQLTRLNADTFLTTRSLEIISLGHNLISNVEHRAFSKLAQLKYLDLSDNHLNVEASNLFKTPDSLLGLKLSRNNISGNFDVATGSGQMENMDLSFNKLVNISLVVDNGGGDIRYMNLNFAGNEVKHILVRGNNTSDKLRSVLRLNLSQNHLICDETLADFVHLAQSTDLIRVEGICEQPIFMKDKFVTDFNPNDLSSNVDKYCPESCKCSKLPNDGIVLDCDNGGLDILPESIPPNVQVLYLTNNNISSLTNLRTSAWSNLKKLHLRDCCGESAQINLKNDLQNLTYLRYVSYTDECWCKPEEFISFTEDGTFGDCSDVVPLPFHSCYRPDKSTDWKMVRCSSSIPVDFNFAQTPTCLIKEGCPDKCTCFLNAELHVVVNCSNQGLTALPRTIPDQTAVLDMSFNEMTTLDINDKEWKDLKILNVRKNKIALLSDGPLPSALIQVELDGNRLESPSGWLNELMSSADTLRPNVSLTDNIWVCQCNPTNFVGWEHSKVVYHMQNLNETFCLKDGIEKKLLDAFLCHANERKNLVIAISCVLSLLVLVAVTSALYYRHSNTVKLWLFTRRWCLCLVNETDLDEDKIYDVFLSYSSDDSDFVLDVLIPGLENAAEPDYCYKVCVHERDWLGGDYIPDQIVRSVEQSRRTIIVLTDNFLNSTWASMEFKVALQKALEDGLNRIIVVIPWKVPSKENMDPDLRVFITMNTYLQYSDKQFWDKLRYIMPHKAINGVKRGNGLRKLSRQFIELISSPTREETNA